MGGKGSGTPKYTREVHAKIIKALEAGCFRTHAARYAGIKPTTLEKWREQGEAGIEPYATLLDDMEQASAKDAYRNQFAISQAAIGKHEGDWKAAAWNLEKKYPKLYGRLAELEQLRAAEIRAAKEHHDKPYSPWKQPEGEQPPKRFDA